jgi:F-type H+-transporting ATPase subunit b
MTPHHVDGVPKVVIWQAINLIILFSVLIYYTKAKIQSFFIEKRSGYLKAAEKSKKLQIEAEKNLLDIKHKLDLLSSYTEENIARVRAEAADLKKSMIADATEAAKRVRDEAKNSAEVEALKAHRMVKNKAISESMKLARQVLTKDIGKEDHQKLQNDFAKGFLGVNP